MRARTGLSEPRVGNDPGPPGPEDATTGGKTAAVLSTDALNESVQLTEDTPS